MHKDGQTLDEARAMAEEALAFHVEGIVQDSEAIPKPSSLESIMADEGGMADEGSRSGGA
jgi:predicted RNase H-like HicB family nuclease